MVLIASLMGLGASAEAPGWEAAISRVLLIGMLLSPLIWTLLWFSSWAAFRHGRPTLAALLSTPPLLALLAYAGVLVFYGAYGAWSERGYAQNEVKEIERVATHNALVAAAMRFETGRLSWPKFEEAIQPTNGS